MSIESRVSGHWTDDDLIAYIYGIPPTDNHLETCSLCQQRVRSMRTNRQTIEEGQLSDVDDVTFEFLAAQRRKVYARLDQPAAWWSALRMRHWASAATTLLLILCGLLMFQEQTVKQQSVKTISDAQLSQEVGQMAQADEPSPTEPLEALFQE